MTTWQGVLGGGWGGKQVGVEEGGRDGSGGGAEHVEPEVGKVACEQGGAEGAGGVERCASEGAAHEDAEDEGATDGDGSHIAGFAKNGGVVDAAHQEKGEEHFDDEALGGGDGGGEGGGSEA